MPRVDLKTKHTGLKQRKIVHFMAFFLLLILVLTIKLYISFVIEKDKSYASDLTISSIIQAVNQERSMRNLTTLNTNAILSSAAQYKAEDMIARHYFSHTDPDNHYIWNKIESLGYKPYSQLGENLAVDFYDTESLISAWMNSPTHRANIINSGFKDQGMGLSFGQSPEQYHSAIANTFGTLTQTKTVKPSSSTPAPPAQKLPTPTPTPSATPTPKVILPPKKTTTGKTTTTTKKIPVKTTTPTPTSTPLPTPSLTPVKSANTLEQSILLDKISTTTQSASTLPLTNLSPLKLRTQLGNNLIAFFSPATTTNLNFASTTPSSSPANLFATSTPIKNKINFENFNSNFLRNIYNKIIPKNSLDINQIVIFGFGIILLILLLTDIKVASEEKLSHLDKKINNLAVLIITLIVVAIIYLI